MVEGAAQSLRPTYRHRCDAPARSGADQRDPVTRRAVPRQQPDAALTTDCDGGTELVNDIEIDTVGCASGDGTRDPMHDCSGHSSAATAIGLDDGTIVGGDTGRAVHLAEPTRIDQGVGSGTLLVESGKDQAGGIAVVRAEQPGQHGDHCQQKAHAVNDGGWAATAPLTVHRRETAEAGLRWPM